MRKVRSYCSDFDPVVGLGVGVVLTSDERNGQKEL